MLLQMEYACEKENFRRQTEDFGIMRKVRRGDAWYPVRTGRTYYNSLNQEVIEIIRQDGSDIEHNFEYGRPVCFFTMSTGAGGGEKSIRYLSFTATVSYAEADRMVVVMPSASHILELQRMENPLGVQLSFDETSYRLMFEALDRVTGARSGRLAYLRDLFYSGAKAARFTFAPTRFPWLNPSQEHAVNEMLAAKDVMVVHGPPGTGKTTTLVEGIYETLRRENQVLVCAQSNMAVDWISEKLTDRGLNVLRIGNPTRVNDKMLSFTYERRFESHPDYSELWGIRKAIREIQSSFRKKSHSEKETARNRLSRLRFRATELEVQIDTDLFSEARVIACTLVGSANRVLTNHTFTTLFIDEAAQALEAACWIAIGKADRVILAGDHHQLPPTIKCIEAARGGLDHTLMQKITDRKPETVSLLKTQYRMNEDIMRFPSRWFYHDELQSAPEVKHRGILEFDTPVVWLDTADCHFEEDRLDDSMSRINRDEATLLVSTLQKYIEKIGKERVLDESIDFGLISPYKSQVQYIRGLIKRDTFFKPFRRLITAHTVDGFQGQERDVIMISLVRANDKGRIGFLGDLRRMNVAITRARMKLMILGDAPTLTRHAFYKELYEYIWENGQVITVQPPSPT